MLAFAGTKTAARSAETARTHAPAAQDIRGFLQQVYTRVITTQQPAYVILQGSQKRLVVASDPLAATVVSTYTIPSDIVLSTTSTDLTTPECNWGLNSGGLHALECDSMGRTIEVLTGSQCEVMQTLVVTHREMVQQTLSPRIKYTITIYPIWNSVAIQAKY